LNLTNAVVELLNYVKDEILKQIESTNPPSSYRKFSKKLGISYSTLQRILDKSQSHETMPKTSTVIKICRNLGIFADLPKDEAELLKNLRLTTKNFLRKKVVQQKNNGKLQSLTKLRYGGKDYPLRLLLSTDVRDINFRTLSYILDVLYKNYSLSITIKDLGFKER